MLRVSSLGLRCYRYKLHSATSPWNTSRAFKYGQRHQQAQSRAAASSHAQRDQDRAGDVTHVESDVSEAQKESDKDEEHDWEWLKDEGDVPPPQLDSADHHPLGNRRRPPVRPLPSWLRKRLSTPVVQSLPTNRSTQPMPEVSPSAGSVYERFQAAIDVNMSNLHGQPKFLPQTDENEPSWLSGAASPAAIQIPSESPVEDYDSARERLLDELATTPNVNAAWEAYTALMRLSPPVSVPREHLDRLTRLIAAIRPRTRALFIRLLSVVSAVHRNGGEVHLWQWNALADFAGKGWRRTSIDMYRTALDVVHDFTAGNAPGATFFSNRADVSLDFDVRKERDEEDEEEPKPRAPDIITFTTLLNIAAKTRDPATLQHAHGLLKASGLAANRITYLTLISFYTRIGELAGVRRTLSGMRDAGLPLGVDGLNACIWAFARHQRFHVAEYIYKVLRNNLVPDPDLDVNGMTRNLAGQDIMITPGLVPDVITYMTLLQPYSYHGQFMPAIQVFADMITHMSSLEDYDGTNRTATEYLLPAYTAMLLGFYRYGAIPDKSLRRMGPYRYSKYHDAVTDSEWSLAALQAIFDDFLEIPADAKPSERLIYWILMSFARITGNDLDKLREVYDQLEERFEGRWGGRLAALKKILHGDLDENAR